MLTYIPVQSLRPGTWVFRMNKLAPCCAFEYSSLVTYVIYVLLNCDIGLKLYPHEYSAVFRNSTHLRGSVVRHFLFIDI